MLISGKKIRASREKKINILTLVLSEKKILNETKKPYPPPPPFKLNGRSLDILNNTLGQNINSNFKSDKFPTGTKSGFFYYAIFTTEEKGLFKF